jgi:hypothetical protein
MSKKKPYVIVRAASAGVFAGELVSRKGDEVVLINDRRLWYWDGAASLSEMSERGPSKPDRCKFPAPTTREHTILGVIEILNCTPAARKAIEAVSPWSQ